MHLGHATAMVIAACGTAMATTRTTCAAGPGRLPAATLTGMAATTATAGAEVTATCLQAWFIYTTPGPSIQHPSTFRQQDGQRVS